MKSIQNKILLILIIVALLPACASVGEINMAMREIDRVWKVKNDKIRQEIGSAVVDATLDEVYDAGVNTLEALGFTISERNRNSGYLFGVAPAPAPLSENEWKEYGKPDEAEAQAIVAKTMPFTSLFTRLHIDGVEVHILTTARPVETGTEVSFEYTIVDHKVINMGLYAPKNPGPTMARFGMIKAWKEFERQLNRVQSKS